MINISNDWQLFFDNEQNQPYYEELRKFLKQEYATHTVYPPMDDIFNAFKLTDLPDVKVVILGNQPYIKEGQADGLAYSSKSSIRLPMQLSNIFQELHTDIGCYVPKNGDLSKWAEQGVFLLNCLLTVRENAASSHRCKGWEEFTDKVIEEVNKKEEPVVFIFWGNYARAKKVLITNPKHLVLESAHPSPFSAYNGFFGSRPFSKTNEFLIANGIKPIDWNIEKDL